MVGQALLSEFDVIIREDYDIQLLHGELADVANTLVGFFELLAKVESQTQKEEKNDKDK